MEINSLPMRRCVLSEPGLKSGRFGSEARLKSPARINWGEFEHALEIKIGLKIVRSGQWREKRGEGRTI